jgi:hypothetical protein
VAAMFHGRHFRLISPPVITFYGGFSKAGFFISKPTTIAELKQSINEEIAAIPEQMTRRVMVRVRLKQCLRNGGIHLSNVLSKM